MHFSYTLAFASFMKSIIGIFSIILSISYEIYSGLSPPLFIFWSCPFFHLGYNQLFLVLQCPSNAFLISQDSYFHLAFTYFLHERLYRSISRNSSHILCSYVHNFCFLLSYSLNLSLSFLQHRSIISVLSFFRFHYTYCCMHCPLCFLLLSPFLSFGFFPVLHYHFQFQCLVPFRFPFILGKFGFLKTCFCIFF